jgi:CheY-like chemotaxis protein
MIIKECKVMVKHLEERPIIIVEDSDEDYEVTIWVLRQAGVTSPIHRCKDKQDIAKLLTNRQDWPKALQGPFPILVVLDINIPGANWKETLGSLRSNFWWQQVPVLILSSTSQPDVVTSCYALGAAGYLKKPIDLDNFVILGRQIAEYWIRAVIHPVSPISDSK